MDTKHAEQNAKNSLSSIVAMVKRLEHSQECAGDDHCDVTDADVLVGLGEYAKDGRKATAEEVERYHDEDAARLIIEEDALSVEVRVPWYAPGGGEVPKPEEYMILLTTGGPALRVRGDLNKYGEPDTARLEYQDWGTPWIEYPLSREDENALIAYASVFYYGE